MLVQKAMLLSPTDNSASALKHKRLGIKPMPKQKDLHLMAATTRAMNGGGMNEDLSSGE